VAANIAGRLKVQITTQAASGAALAAEAAAP
jgi:hypothetical protein